MTTRVVRRPTSTRNGTSGRQRRREPTPLEHFEEVLGDKRCEPNRGRARCPAHSDRTPSLSFSENEYGTVLVHCFAGCPFEDVIAELGLVPADLRGDNDPSTAKDAYMWTPGDVEAEAVYSYADEDWRLLYEMLRLPDKKFIARQPNPQHGLGGEPEWLWNLDETKRVPYRLPELCAAVEEGDVIYVVEGEKDVDALRSAGYSSTCNPGGAGRWKDEFSAYFESAEVVVVQDKDDPGRRHARKVVASLRTHGARSVRLVEARVGKDSWDHLDAGYGVDDFVEVAEGQDVSADLVEGASPMVLEPFRDLVADVEPLGWLVEDVIAHVTHGMIAGEKKTFKTWLALHLAIAVASGEAFLGRFKVPVPMPVVYFVGEGGRGPTQRRLSVLKRRMGVVRDLPLHLCFNVAPVSGQRFREAFDRSLDLHPGLVIVDPWYAYHGASTNASNLFEEGGLLTGLSAPAAEAGTSLFIVNHFNKTGGGRSLDRITQSGSAEWVDSWMLLSHRGPSADGDTYPLALDIGSRQWGEAEWDLDLKLTERRVDWQIWERDNTTGPERIENRIKKVLSEHPFEYTKSQLKAEVVGNGDAISDTLDRMVEEKVIVQEPRERVEGKDKRTRRRDVYGLPG